VSEPSSEARDSGRQDTDGQGQNSVEQQLAAALSQQSAGRYVDLGRRADHTPQQPLRPAAVLLWLERTPGYSIILTKRTDLVEHHKGEISLAGGMTDPDDRDATHTALREAHEELGIEPQHVDVVGSLGELITVTSFAVQPIIGIIDAGYPLVPQETEVASVLHVPMSVLRDPNAWFEDVRQWRGERFVLRSCRWQGEVIWGATAKILQRFLEVVPAEVL
jgi:8-oxo-dGTP pyrophosphatase MutT (NUDIX family)